MNTFIKYFLKIFYFSNTKRAATFSILVINVFMSMTSFTFFVAFPSRGSRPTPVRNLSDGFLVLEHQSEDDV